MTSKMKWSDVVAIYGIYNPHVPAKFHNRRTDASKKGHIHGYNDAPHNKTVARMIHAGRAGQNPPPINKKLKLKLTRRK